jgi:hypothetical protein
MCAWGKEIEIHQSHENEQTSGERVDKKL